MSVTAHPQARHTLCPNFCLFVLFMFQGSQPTSRTIYLSTRVSIKRAHPHTDCVPLQAGAHKRLEKKPQLCSFRQEEVHTWQRPWPWSRSAISNRVEVSGGQSLQEAQICAEPGGPRARELVRSSVSYEGSAVASKETFCV